MIRGGEEANNEAGWKCAALAAALVLGTFAPAITVDAVGYRDWNFFGIQFLDKDYPEQSITIEGGTYVGKGSNSKPPQDMIYVSSSLSDKYKLTLKNVNLKKTQFLVERGGYLRFEGCTVDYYKGKRTGDAVDVTGSAQLEAKDTVFNEGIGVDECGKAYLKNCHFDGKGHGGSIASGRCSSIEVKGGSIENMDLLVGDFAKLDVSGLEKAELTGFNLLGFGGQMDMHDCGYVNVCGPFKVQGTLNIKNSFVEVWGNGESKSIESKINLDQGARMIIHGDLLSESPIEISGGASLDVYGSYTPAEGSAAAIIVDGIPQNIPYAKGLHLASSQG